MSRITTKPVFRVSDQVLHKLGCTTTEDAWRLEISTLGSREIVISVEKIKVLISCMVTAVPLFLHMQKACFLMTRLIYQFINLQCDLETQKEILRMVKIMYL